MPEYRCRSVIIVVGLKKKKLAIYVVVNGSCILVLLKELIFDIKRQYFTYDNYFRNYELDNSETPDIPKISAQGNNWKVKKATYYSQLFKCKQF